MQKLLKDVALEKAKRLLAVAWQGLRGSYSHTWAQISQFSRLQCGVRNAAGFDLGSSILSRTVYIIQLPSMGMSACM